VAKNYKPGRATQLINKEQEKDEKLIPIGQSIFEHCK
jgi:hypothetical protein